MKKLRGGHGRATDICVQHLRHKDSNGIKVKEMETQSEDETASPHTGDDGKDGKQRKTENNDERLQKSRVNVSSNTQAVRSSFLGRRKGRGGVECHGVRRR